MKLGTYQARSLLRGDVTIEGVVLDCIGDGQAEDGTIFVLATFRQVGHDVSVRRRYKATHLVEVTGHQDI